MERFAAAVEDAGVALVGLNLYSGDRAVGERGIAALPGRAVEFRDALDVAATLTARLGVRVVCNTLLGVGGDPVMADEHLALAVERLAATPVLEPLSGVPGYPLRAGADALAVADRVPGTALLADLYHLGVNGDDVDALIIGQLDRIAHVQVADAPGRHEPGTGSLPLGRWLAVLRHGGYAGDVALEYVAGRPGRPRPELPPPPS